MVDDGLPPLREVIERHGLAAKKSLGQNFLFDLNLTRRIARAAGALEGFTIVEVGPGPGGLTHFTLDLSTPINLAANTSANSRWFIAIIGLTQQPFVTWNWAQGTGGSIRTYQFIRGAGGGGPLFRSLPEGRALVLGVSCSPGFNGDGTVDFFDYLDFVDAFAAGC